MREHKQHVLQFPDLRFASYCCKTFGVNRGVFNVVDEWFFEQGIVDVLTRRNFIVHFFETLYQENKDISFGSGGVKKALHTFWAVQRTPQKVENPALNIHSYV